jgi:hypothetical protein
MNNPDEKTAIEQFGDGDKYFGVSALMSTLPGLPMFGHGQFEGYREKYGMEFRRPKWEEWPNEGLMRGHEWKIFPLLHKRYVFAEVDNFLLYDFVLSRDPQRGVEGGQVNEDVFAFSNGFGSGYGTEKRISERGLVVYHNKYAETAGWVKTSVGFMDKASGQMVQRTLAEGLDLPREGYAIFRDYTTHLEYIRSCAEIWEKGLFFIMNAYQCQVFLDWRFVGGEQWQKVCESLSGAGVDSVQTKFEELFPPVKEEVVEVKKKRVTRKKAVGEKKETVKKPRVGKKAKAEVK